MASMSNSSASPDLRPAPGPVQAVLFDHDGVLVDSEPLHRIAWERTFGARGIRVSEEDYEWSIGRRDLIFAGIIITKHGLHEAPEAVIADKRKHMLRMMAEEAKTIDGAQELVRRLDGEYRLGLVSSAMRPEIDITLSRFGFAEFFQAVISCGDTAKHKPDPEPYRLCAERLGVPLEACVALEDSASGIESAKSAGAFVIGVATTLPREKLTAAHVIIDNLSDTDRTLHLIRTRTA
jgi:HAD superfamily hydrolase (TIGR01509 family)